MKKTKLETKREIAKIGMATSLFLTAGSTMFLKIKQLDACILVLESR